ncbi:MAG: hypothetical protein GY855_08795 [candidate division Zixibacteria bacterium]|nr:hypothetical protein [candidate division Zixibacteria bacterium]
MENDHNKTMKFLRFLSQFGELCSEFPVSLIIDEILPKTAGYFPKCSVGIMISSGKNKSSIAVSGDPIFVKQLETLLNDYSQSEGMFKHGDSGIQIKNGEFVLKGVNKLRLIIRGLEFNGRNYGVIALLTRDYHKITSLESNYLEAIKNLIAASAANEALQNSVKTSPLLTLSNNPKEVGRALFNEVMEKLEVKVVAIGYLLPDNANCELYIITGEETKTYDKFNPDLTIPKSYFDKEIAQKQWNCELNAALLPEELAVELKELNITHTAIFPLKGKNEPFGFCIVGSNGVIEEDKRDSISEIILRLQPTFASAAGLSLLISSYKKLASLDDNELIQLTTATVNHHINNHLAVILGVAQLILLSESSLPDDFRRKIEMIEENGLRIKDVIASLRNIKNINIADYLAGNKFLDIG